MRKNFFIYLCTLILSISGVTAYAESCSFAVAGGKTDVMVQSLSMRYFPRKYDAKITDAALRQAMYEAHGNIDFYNTRRKLLFHEMRIDHIWPRNPKDPRDPPGPDNIVNFVPTNEPENRIKSNRLNRSVTISRIERNLNNHVDEVYRRYMAIKKGMKNKNIPNSKMEEILSLLSRSSLSEKHQKWVLDVVIKNFNAPIKTLEVIVKQIIQVIEGLRGESLAELKKSDVNNFLKALEELSEIEKKFRVQPQSKSNSDFVRKYYSMGAHLISMLQVSKREWKKFNSYGQVKSFFNTFVKSLNESHRRSQNLAQYVWRRYRGDENAFIKSILVRNIYSNIFRQARSASSRSIILNDYKRTIQILSKNFIPSEINSLIQKVKDLKRTNRLGSLEAAAKIFIRVKNQNPEYSFTQIVNAVNRE